MGIRIPTRGESAAIEAAAAGAMPVSYWTVGLAANYNWTVFITINPEP